MSGRKSGRENGEKAGKKGWHWDDEEVTGVGGGQRVSKETDTEVAEEPAQSAAKCITLNYLYVLCDVA